MDLVSAEGYRLAAPLLIAGDHSLAHTGFGKRGRGAASILEPTPTPEPLHAETTYFIGEKAAGIRILFC